jgi:REP element-mobilizing transposase RayT
MPTSHDPHCRNLRLGRFSEPERVYSVTAATHGRIPYFLDLKLGRYVVSAFRFQNDCGRASTLAYVVMPDHFHWLIRLGTDTSLSEVMRSAKGFSARQINFALGAKHRKVWQAGFHDHAVRREENMVGIARYLLENPLRAGLVENIGEYALWDADWVDDSWLA